MVLVENQLQNGEKIDIWFNSSQQNALGYIIESRITIIQCSIMLLLLLMFIAKFIKIFFIVMWAAMFQLSVLFISHGHGYRRQKRKAVDRQRQTFFFSFSNDFYLFLHNVFFCSRTCRFINFYRLNSFIFPARKEQKWNALRRWCSMLEWFVHIHLSYELITFMIVNHMHDANQGRLVNAWINFLGENIELSWMFRVFSTGLY